MIIDPFIDYMNNKRTNNHQYNKPHFYTKHLNHTIDLIQVLKYFTSYYWVAMINVFIGLLWEESEIVSSSMRATGKWLAMWGNWIESSLLRHNQFDV